MSIPEFYRNQDLFYENQEKLVPGLATPPPNLSYGSLFVCLLLNGTSALFWPLVPRIVEVEHMRYVKNDL